MKDNKTEASGLKAAYGAFKTDHPKAFKGIKYTLIGGTILFVLGVLLLLGFFLAILNGYYGELPSKSELKPYKIRLPPRYIPKMGFCWDAIIWKTERMYLLSKFPLI